MILVLHLFLFYVTPLTDRLTVNILFDTENPGFDLKSQQNNHFSLIPISETGPRFPYKVLHWLILGLF